MYTCTHWSILYKYLLVCGNDHWIEIWLIFMQRQTQVLILPFIKWTATLILVLNRLSWNSALFSCINVLWLHDQGCISCNDVYTEVIHAICKPVNADFVVRSRFIFMRNCATTKALNLSSSVLYADSIIVCKYRLYSESALCLHNSDTIRSASHTLFSSINFLTLILSPLRKIKKII